MLRSTSLLLGLFASSILLADTPSSTSETAFQAHSHFHYNLYWSHLKVGIAELRFIPEEDTGHPLLKIEFKVQTTGFADTLYPVRTVVESWLDPETREPVRFRKKQHEGKRKRDDELVFDRSENTVTYTRSGDTHPPAPIPPHTLDPLSLLLGVAQNPLAVGNKFKTPATDGRATADVKTQVVAQEIIEVCAGNFDSYKLDVSTEHLRGVFAKSPDALIEIWFSADAYRIPLKMRSEVRVGSFFAELDEASIVKLKDLSAAPSWQPVRSFWGNSRHGRR